MKYRADIDGLRAIAVTLVILFHAKTGLFSGGYIGVDVFFAISGFLITSIIYSKMLAGTFSFGDFYIRRAKRILPASLFMTFATVLTFSIMYPPDLFQIVTESGISSLLFSSNLYFWQTAGYFSPNVELQPLLHTWSLSVEEQFYFLFPLMLLALLALKLSKTAIIFLLSLSCLLSLALAIIYAPNSLSHIGFYVLPTRFYEMGLGALLAVFLIHHPDTFKRFRYLRELGLIAILSSALLYDKALAFPSYYALLPVIGTLLMIMDSSKSGLTYRLLSSKPTIFIGLLSYSLYLWHWPIWVAFEWLFDESSILIPAIYFVTTAVVSYASYLFIEKPMRELSFYRSALKSGFVIVGFTSLVIILGLLNINSNRSLLPISQPIMQTYSDSLRSEPFRDKCTDSKRLKGGYSICVLKSSPNADHKILLWGDSHASAMMSALTEFSDDFHIDAMNTSGCPGLIGIKRKDSLDCHLHNNFLKNYLKTNPEKYDLILNVTAWGNYIEMDLLGNELSSSAEQMQSGIGSTIDFYNDIGVKHLFISQIPKYEVDIPLSFFRFHMGRTDSLPTMPKDDYVSYLNQFQKMFPVSANILSFEGIFCDEVLCNGTYEDIILYQDSHHISVSAAQLMSNDIESRVKNILLFTDKNNNDEIKPSL